MLQCTTSLTVRFLKNIRQGYLDLENGLDRIYQNSRIYKSGQALWLGSKTNFRYSFLGRLTDIENPGNPAILENSGLVNWIIRVYNRSKERTSSYSRGSIIAGNLKILREELQALPVKTGGIIISTAILTNIIFSIFLDKEIGAWGWLLRLLLLSAAGAGIFCNVNWNELKTTSRVINYLNKRSERIK